MDICNIVVKTNYGEVEGCLINDIFAFKGIPFAAPLSGENRWLPPKPPCHWTGIRRAHEFGDICPQMTVRYHGRYSEILDQFMKIPATQSDDFLNLNIWTPSTDPEAKLPVMVWIHGGSSLMAGAGSLDIYSGHRLAKRDAVIVTLNYRVGILGFLAGEELFDGDFCIGNRGLLDQVAALKWLKENVIAFGGDPANITLFGESSGANCIMALMASPIAKGHFQRAIVQSGFVQDAPIADHTKLTRIALQKLAVKPGDREALSHITSAQLVELTTSLMSEIYLPWKKMRYGKIARQGSIFTPATGTHFLPASILNGIATGISKDVDLLIGTNRDEIRLNALMNGGKKLGSLLYWYLSKGNIGNKRKQLRFKAAYNTLLKGEENWMVRERLLTDAVYWQPALKFTEQQIKINSERTFMYRFDHISPVHEGDFGATHMMEIPFIFDLLEQWETFVGPAAEGQALADEMATAWVEFARNGRPESKNLPAWPIYDLATRSTMIFDKESKIEEDPDANQRKVWTKLG